LRQPTKMTCGQTCVAMVAGISVDEAIQVIGKTGGTHGSDLIRGMKKLGVACSKKSKVTDGLTLPKRAILRQKLRDRKKKWGGHWVLYLDGIIYDPGPGISMPVAEYRDQLMQKLRFTSYITLLSTEDLS